jgi:outer membrane protein
LYETPNTWDDRGGFWRRGVLPPVDVKELSIQMKFSRAFVFLLASGLALSAAAQTPSAPAGPAKIAVIAFQATVGQTNEGQRNFADLQKKFEPQRQQLKALSDEIDRMTKELQTQGDALGDTVRASRARAIDEKKKQLDRSAEDAKNDYQGQVQELYASLASKVYDVLSSYAQQQGYTLVLDMGQQSERGRFPPFPILECFPVPPTKATSMMLH